MWRVSLVAACLTLLFALALGAIHAQPNDVEAVRDFLGHPAATCAPPCFMGIRAGLTTADDAAAALRASDWVRMVGQTDSMIVWQWSGRQPAWINPALPGQLTLTEGHVAYLVVETTVPVGELWLTYGVPTAGYIAFQPRTMIHFVSYPVDGFDAWIALTCPVTRREFWEAPASIYWGMKWRATLTDNAYPRLWREHVTC